MSISDNHQLLIEGQSPLSTPRLHTVREEIAKMLRREIQSGQLKPGVRLLQDHLAREFSVSQGAIREALGQLASEGLVAIEPRKGAVVRVLTQAEMTELLHLRVLLEADLLRRSIPAITSGGIALLREALYEMSNPTGDSDWPTLNWNFHSTIYKFAGSPQAVELAERLHTTMSRHTVYEIANTDAMLTSNKEHAQLVDLVEEKRTASAVSLLKRHIRPHIGVWLDDVETSQTRHLRS